MKEDMDVRRLWRIDWALSGVNNFWLKMMTPENKNTKAALRVAINDDGTVDLIDFTMPSLRGTLRKNVPQGDVPTWVMHNVCVLRISEEGDYVKDIGVKVNDYLYYLEPKEGED